MLEARDLIDRGLRDLAHETQKRLEAGETPNKQALSALQRYERELRIKMGLLFVEACPKSTLLEQLSWTSKSLHDFGDRWGMQLRGKDVNLWDFLRGLIRIPGDIRYSKSRHKNLDEVDQEINMESLRRKVHEREQREGKYIPRDVVHDVHQRWAARLRELGKTLDKQYGGNARNHLDDALDDCIAIMESLIGDINDAEDAEQAAVERERASRDDDAAGSKANGHLSKNKKPNKKSSSRNGKKRAKRSN